MSCLMPSSLVSLSSSSSKSHSVGTFMLCWSFAVVSSILDKIMYSKAKKIVLLRFFLTNEAFSLTYSVVLRTLSIYKIEYSLLYFIWNTNTTQEHQQLKEKNKHTTTYLITTKHFDIFSLYLIIILFSCQFYIPILLLSLQIKFFN